MGDERVGWAGGDAGRGGAKGLKRLGVAKERPMGSRVQRLVGFRWPCRRPAPTRAPKGPNHVATGRPRAATL